MRDILFFMFLPFFGGLYCYHFWHPAAVPVSMAQLPFIAYLAFAIIASLLTYQVAMIFDLRWRPVGDKIAYAYRIVLMWGLIAILASMATFIFLFASNVAWDQGEQTEEQTVSIAAISVTTNTGRHNNGSCSLTTTSGRVIRIERSLCIAEGLGGFIKPAKAQIFVLTVNTGFFNIPYVKALKLNGSE